MIEPSSHSGGTSVFRTQPLDEPRSIGFFNVLRSVVEPSSGCPMYNELWLPSQALYHFGLLVLMKFRIKDPLDIAVERKMSNVPHVMRGFFADPHRYETPTPPKTTCANVVTSRISLISEMEQRRENLEAFQANLFHA